MQLKSTLPLLATLISPILSASLNSDIAPRSPESQPSLTWTTYLNPPYAVYDPPNNYTFSPTTYTLISGPENAILIDTPLSVNDSEKVVTWIEKELAPNNVTLKYVYITHGHGDHFFGLPTILSHFPSATVIATQGTIDHAKEQLEPAQFDTFWGPYFPNQIAPQTETWNALPSDGLFSLDGYAFQAIEVGQTDTSNSTVLHVPSLKLVVTGDAVYGSCFQYLQETSTPALRAEWLKALIEVEKLEPEIVIPSHRQEWDDFSINNIARTREYLRSWEIELLESAGRQDLKERVGAVFPERIGDFILELSVEGGFPNATNGTA
ncbi:related to Zn-dependent hydrolases, including glyoxylases [Phialocephala subalpina]|uniref:Related to Zn-dependent hydrolases, including glyoxylases n=1 Tax=Phialocephala subalpina TaxID=576137 RepID=A0A1L7WX22_9HELO|nr:related to Zn-dependent hydrolases, including glyoxylases [Phialocephala subalpina]